MVSSREASFWSAPFRRQAMTARRSTSVLAEWTQVRTWSSQSGGLGVSAGESQPRRSAGLVESTWSPSRGETMWARVSLPALVTVTVMR